MSSERMTRDGLVGDRPATEAVSDLSPSGPPRRRRGRRSGERSMVPRPTFRSYYGEPIINAPRWEPLNIAGYLFLGGLAGASSVIAAGAELTGRPALAKAGKLAALAAIGGSAAALVKDLGRPARFVNMLRTVKPTSPMSVGSWILTAYGPLAGAAAATAVTGWFPRLGRAATVGAAFTGPAVAAYTGVLLADTAVPAWHEAHRQLPFTFIGSAAAAAGGLGMVLAPVQEAGPARRAAVFGAVVETVSLTAAERGMGIVAETYRDGRAGTLLRASKVLTVSGALGGALLGRRSRTAAVLSGAALLAGSICTRFGIFEAGLASARDPKYTVVPQRERLAQRSAG